MFRARLLVASIVAIGPLATEALANGWQSLKRQPGFNASTMFLLMDGRVLVNEYLGTRWKILTPDASGSYLNGTWSNATGSWYDGLFYASGVLNDGRVIVCGGEYSNSGGGWSKQCEIYDPSKDKWTRIAPPTNWKNIGDAPSVVLNDGRFMIGSDFDRHTAIYDPVADSWSAGADGLDPQSNDEQTWTLMPDGTFMTLECFNPPQSDLYDPVHDVWVAIGPTPKTMIDSASECGPALMIYTGDLFQLGATATSALYTPSSTYAGVGTWTDGPQPPLIGSFRIRASDAPCCILPSGNVLCALGHGSSAPTYMCEYDGTQIVRVPDPSNNNDGPYNTRLLPLPTGEVLFADGTIELYTPDGSPDASWKPTITSMATDLIPGDSYLLSGTQLNGLTTGNAYGDECGVETNYPIVRLHYTKTNHVVYCSSHDRSTCAIATGSAVLTTHVDVPAGAELGAANLEVVANGIASDPFPVMVRSAITIDFDSLATGVIVTNQFPDATFSAPAGFANWTVALNDGTSQPNVIMTGPSGGGTDGLENTFVDFRCPMASLTFSGAGIDGTGTVASVNVFENGVLAGTVPVVGNGNPAKPVVVDLTAFGNVTRIEITAITDAGGIAWDDFRFCLASSASWSNYGSGFAGTLGVPGLTAESKPVLGASLKLDLGNSLGATTTALLMTGVQQAVIPTTKGGDLLLVPLMFVPLSLPATGVTLSGSIPNDPTLCGVQVYAQALELDGGAAKGLSFTEGLDLSLGY